MSEKCDCVRIWAICTNSNGPADIPNNIIRPTIPPTKPLVPKVAALRLLFPQKIFRAWPKRLLPLA